MKKNVPPGRGNAARNARACLFAVLSPLLFGCSLGPAAMESATPVPRDIEIAVPIKLASRARVLEKEPGFLSAEVRAGELDIEHDGGLAALTPGDVLSGTQGGGYLVRVTEARARDATHITVMTTPASLTDLIAEGEFRVHYDARREAEALRAERPGALSLSLGSTVKLLDLEGVELPAACGGIEGGAATIDAAVELSPVLDLDVKIGPRGLFDPVPEIKRFELDATGRLDLDAKLSAHGALSGACSIDLLALTGGALSVPLPSLTFWAGPVPIVVESEITPTAEADVAISLSGGAVRTASRTSLSLTAGVDYEDEAWSPIWDPSAKVRGGAEIEASGPLDVSCAVRAGAEIRARLYGVIGPSIGVQVSGRARAASAPGDCAYEGRIDGGVNGYVRADAGVSVGPLDLTLASLDLIDLDLVHLDGPRLSGKLAGPGCGAAR